MIYGHVFKGPPVPPLTLTRRNAYRTAISRKNPSVPARLAIEKYKPKIGFNTILDWGCGQGRDRLYFDDMCGAAESYDPHFFPDKPGGLFQFAMCTYVLNVIASRKERLECLAEIRKRLKSDGHVLVTVRPAKHIYDLAFDYDNVTWKRRRKYKWNKLADGYVTTRGNFQAIMGINTLAELIEEAGFEVRDKVDNSNLIMVLAQKI